MKIQVAKYLGCKPWELEERGFWFTVGLDSMNAHREYENQQAGKQGK